MVENQRESFCTAAAEDAENAVDLFEDFACGFLPSGESIMLASSSVWSVGVFGAFGSAFFHCSEMRCMVSLG